MVFINLSIWGLAVTSLLVVDLNMKFNDPLGTYALMGCFYSIVHVTFKRNVGGI